MLPSPMYNRSLLHSRYLLKVQLMYVKIPPFVDSLMGDFEQILVYSFLLVLIPSIL